MSKTDLQYMQRALALAESGRYSSRPNPVVGCVIVSGDGIVAEGWHEKAGADHAEIMALKKAGDKARGAVVYVSLEPCSHIGKTGPCTEALIKAGIKRLVYAVGDPNPRVNGKGLEQLKVAGIKVDGPIMDREALEINQGFFKSMIGGLPFVRCKLAMSLDGRTAMASGESKWITGDDARADVQKLRARSGAVLTGIETVLKDDPGLDVRADISCVQPLRAIVDSRLRISANAKILQQPGRILLATAVTNEELLADKAKALDNDRVFILSCANAAGRVDLEKLLRFLVTEEQCHDVLLESGPQLAGAMLESGLVDEVVTYIAPKFMGSEARPLFDLPGLESMGDAIQMEIVDVAMVGKDCRMRTRRAPTATVHTLVGKS